jgi:flagellin
MKIDVGAQNILRQMGRTDKALGNTQAQIASGLQNPNPASDPLASTLAKRLSIDVSTTKRVQSVVSQTKNTIEIAHSTLRANADLLTTMKAQAIQASNGIYTNEGRVATLDPTFQQNIAQFDSNAHATWGTRTLFDGTLFINCQTDAHVVEANVTGSITDTALSEGDLTINSLDVGATSSDTAKAVAQAINLFTSSTQVTASALTSATGTGIFDSVSVANPIIIINDVEVSIGSLSDTESADQVIGQVVAAINAHPDMAELNISALNVNGHLQINANDGSELAIWYSGISADNVAGPAATAYSGTVSLSSVSSITIGGSNPENAGFSSEIIKASGITTVTFGDMRAAAIFGSTLPDLTTQANAQLAITAIDTALSTVLNELTHISLYSTQFEQIEENMETMSLNLQDDLSSIEDVDFAEAITNSERLKVLKEAATATLRTQFTHFEKLGHLVAESLRGH